jgi:hypothetical protein
MRKLRWLTAITAIVALVVSGILTFNLFGEQYPAPGVDDAQLISNQQLPSEPPVAAISPPSRNEASARLPVTRVVVFNSGVAYFERQAEVEGDCRIDLSFPVHDINDMLKSMVVQDLNGGQVSAVSFDSQAPVEKTLGSFAIDLSKNPSFGQIMDQARGERVELVLQQSNTTQPGTMSGAIVGIEKQKLPVGKDGIVESEFLNMWCAEGMRSVKLSDVQRVRFLNPIIESEFRKALDVIAQSHDTEKKTVSLNCTGHGRRTIKVGYVVENPIWKTSYRLVLDKDKKPFLQGWAVVENSTDDDWNNVAINLISGRPISFQMDLYQSLNVPRPTVEPELFASLRPQTYSGRVLQSPPVYLPAPCATACTSGGPSAASMAPTSQPKAPKEMTDFAMMSEGIAEQPKPAQPIDLSKGVASVANAVNLGDFYSYEIDHAVSLGRQKSAMLPIINQSIEADRVSIYNERVHARFPLLGLKFKNNTDLHLNQGPITVFDSNTYAGDSRILDLQPKEERLISYAIDLGTEVTPVVSSDNGRRTSVKIVKGVIHTKSKTRETKKYRITNRTEQDRTVLIEHPFRSDFKLVNSDNPSTGDLIRIGAVKLGVGGGISTSVKMDKPVETAGDVYRFQLKVKPHETMTQVVVEERDDGEQIAIGNADDNTVKIIINDVAAGKELKDALHTAMAMKQELAKTIVEIAEHQREQDRIKNEQPRIRENLKVLPDADPLVKKLRDKLSQQETELEKHEATMHELEKMADQERKDFEAFLASLNVE